MINAAAWTNVDAAEADEAAATAVNGTAVANLAAACAADGTRLIQVSTDYVFAGDADTPYPEDAPTAPVNAYGRSKLVGEQAVARLLPDTGYVVRTAWLYGAHGPNFVATMLRLAAQREHLDVVDDQHGQPTWSYALAERLVDARRRGTGRSRRARRLPRHLRRADDLVRAGPRRVRAGRAGPGPGPARPPATGIRVPPPGLRTVC